MTTNSYPDHLDHIAFPDNMETVRHFSLRLAQEPCSLPKEKLYRAKKASEFLRSLMEDRPRKEFGALFLSLRNEVIGYSIAFTGTVNQVNAQPREIVVPALLAGPRRSSCFATSQPATARRNSGMTIWLSLGA